MAETPPVWERRNPGEIGCAASANEIDEFLPLRLHYLLSPRRIGGPGEWVLRTVTGFDEPLPEVLEVDEFIRPQRLDGFEDSV